MAMLHFMDRISMYIPVYSHSHDLSDPCLSIDLHPEEWEGVLRSAFEGASFGIVPKKMLRNNGNFVSLILPHRQSQAVKTLHFFSA